MIAGPAPRLRVSLLFLAFLLCLALPGAASAVDPDTIGLFRPDAPPGNNTYFLRNHNTLDVPANIIAGFGNTGDTGVVGDWDGDGITTIGVFRPDTPTGMNSFFLRNTNNIGTGDVKVESIGENGDLPIVGDWDGNGTTTVGLFRPNSPPGSNTFFLWNSNNNPPGPPDIIIAGIGAVGDLPIAGKWTGSGGTSIGLFRPNSPLGSNTFFIWNSLPLTPPYNPDHTVAGIGANGDVGIAGDWDADGKVTVGLFRSPAPAGTNTFFLWNTDTATLAPPYNPDVFVVGFGAVGDHPVAGHWGNNPPVIASAIRNVPENSANNTNVGAPLTFSDPDNPGAGQTLTLSITAGNTGTTFKIDNTGQIKVNDNTLLDFETHPTFNLTVRVTDNGTPPFFSEAAVTVNVDNVNEAPVMTAGGTLAYQEGDPAKVIDSGVTVTDPDSANLTQATVQITTNFQSGSDVLACPAGCNGLNSNFAAGTLTLSNNASPATYQAALKTVTFQNTSDNPTATGTSRQITWIAKDDTALSSTAVTSTINITAVNDAPVLANIEVGALGYTENAAATPITSTLTVTDADSTNLTGATIQITSNCTSPEDVLSFTTQNGISGLYTAGCLMTLSGNSLVANYEAALRSVKYSNSSDNPSTATRTVTFQVNDGALANNLSNTQTRNITVTAVNDPPTANGFTGLPAQAGIPITYPVGKLGGTDPAEGTAVTINTTSNSLCAGCLLTLNTDGSFVFTPPPSAAGTTVSFTYHVTDSGNPPPGVDSAPATVSFAVASPAIYFVKSAAVGVGNCTLGNECTLATAVANIGATTNARIFISDANNHATAVPLNSGGWLIGQGVTTAFDTLFGIVAPAQGTLAARPSTNLTRPTVQNTVTLNATSTVRGLDLSTTTNTGLSGGSVTGVTVNEMNVTTTTGTAVSFNGTGGTVTLDSVTATGGTNNVSLTNVTGTVTMNGGALSGATGSSFLVIGGTGSFTYSGNITQSNNAALVSVTSGHTAGTITFQTGTLSATNGTGLQFNNADGTYNFNGTTTLNGGDAGIDISNGSGGTFSFNANTTITNPSGVAFNVDGTSAAVTGGITYNGTISKSSAGRLIDFENYDTGTAGFTGTLTCDTSCTGIEVQNSSGTVSFSAATKTLNTTSASAAVNLVNNGNVNFTGGGLSITTSSGIGFSATGGGTIAVTGSNNTINSTSATALNVSSTTIGASGLTFKSISSGNNTAAGDPANGIVLNTTGASGGLTVQGDGGGSSNGSGGTIQHTTGDGILLTSTTNLSLNYMNVQNGGGSGIHGTGLTNFTLTRSTVTGNGTTTAHDGLRLGEASGSVVGVTGTVSISNSSITGNAHNNVHIRNTSGTISSFSVTNSTIGGFKTPNASPAANAFVFEGSGTSVLTAGSITGSTFSNNSEERALEIQAHDTATVGTFTVSGGTFGNDNGIHASFTQDGSSNPTFKFLNNGVTQVPPAPAHNLLQPVNVFSSSQATGGTLVGTISGNNINVTATASNIRDIDGVIQGQTDATLLIDGNTVNNTSSNRGISMAFRGPANPLAGTLGANSVISDLTITNNTVTLNSAVFPGAAISLEADNQSGADNKAPTVRADIRLNTVPGSGVCFDFFSACLQFYEYDAAGGHGIGQLVDTGAASPTATSQLQSTNTGTSQASDPGGSDGGEIQLIAGPINTPP